MGSYEKSLVRFPSQKFIDHIAMITFPSYIFYVYFFIRSEKIVIHFIELRPTHFT